jgi:hypothetical protein
MKKNIIAILCISHSFVQAQGPAITSWLQNNSITGYYYPKTGPVALTPNNILVNCQSVQYTANHVYVSTKGIPAYPIGPYLDNNPNQAGSQNAIFKFPLAPVQNTGAPVSTNLGNIAVFINGVAAFDAKDGMSWKSSTSAWAGGPLGGTGDGVWQRDAIVYERAGFDCAKGHPAGTNYHHHQNPSAFKNDITIISTVCATYNSDGLYSINPSQHSPLIGFAYDGFPIYGAYAYKNIDGTGGIVRMKSGYQLRNITTRNTINNVSVTSGPPVNSTYPLGSCIQDYEWVSNSSPDYLDVHNGRFCVTPEYPNGTYCYFATVDANHNSAFPYLIGPTYYGVYADRKVSSITETTTTYTPTTTFLPSEFEQLNTMIFPNPASEMIIVHVNGLLKNDLEIKLYDVQGKLVKQTTFAKGSTMAYLDVETLYNGHYILNISNGENRTTKKIVVQHE